MLPVGGSGGRFCQVLLLEPLRLGLETVMRPMCQFSDAGMYGTIGAAARGIRQHRCSTWLRLPQTSCEAICGCPALLLPRPAVHAVLRCCWSLVDHT